MGYPVPTFRELVNQITTWTFSPAAIRHGDAREGVPGHEPAPLALLDQLLAQHLPHRGPVQLRELHRGIRQVPRDGLQV